MEGVVMSPSSSFWAGKRVFVTGHTGFKGAWLTCWLKRMGAEVFGVALAPKTKPALYELLRLEESMDSSIGDIRDSHFISELVQRIEPDIVFHLAAQSLVRASYREPLLTWQSNVIGTANVLDALRSSTRTRVAIMITTDKVYFNNEWPYPYREDDRLGGYDPYSASKAACELLIQSYRSAFLDSAGIAVASARAGNVIGGGDWSEDRVFPDAIRAWQGGQPLVIRQPESIRPWQHVLDPLCGYLLLAELLWTKPVLAGAYNFGPQTDQAATVREVIEIARREVPGLQVQYGDTADGPHEAGWLALETAKARFYLDFSPKWNLKEAVFRTMRWYTSLTRGSSAELLCMADLDEYERLSE